MAQHLSAGLVLEGEGSHGRVVRNLMTQLYGFAVKRRREHVFVHKAIVF